MCTFSLAGHRFGVDVVDVQEVVRARPLTRVPLARPDVAGLLNLRGRILTVLDLRRRMALPERPDGTPPMNVVVRAAQGPVSLLVDAIGDVVEVDRATFELPPDTLTGVARDVIVGAYKLDGYLLLELDIDRVLAGAAASAS